MSSSILPLCDQEIHINQAMDDPSTWHVFTDSPKWQRRLEKMGVPVVRVMGDGVGREYKLRLDQILFRKGKMALSAAERSQRSARMQAMRKTE